MKPHSSIRVVVIEDDPTTREQLAIVIDRSPGLKFIGGFETCESAIKHFHESRPDVVLLDLGLPGGMDGITCVREIKSKWPLTKVLVFSGDFRRETIVDSFSEGADGFMDKGSPRQKLVDSIVRVHEGRYAASEIVLDQAISYFHLRTPLLTKLSPRERKILEEFSRGGSMKEIADRLGSSIDTVKTHAKRICDKMGVTSLRAAAHVKKELAF